MASPVEASLQSWSESPLEWGQEEVEEAPLPEEFGDLLRPELPWELDRTLVALCRERGPLRAVLSRIAFRLVWLRAWERIGYARLSDYAAECLGLSARWVRDLARVGLSLRSRPRLEHALVSGTLGWTKVRLLARLPEQEDEAAWIAYARRITAEELSKQVRAVDRGSVEAGAAEQEGAKSRGFEVRCTPEVRSKWHAARGAARRAAGQMLHPSEAAELIAAEVLSALPMDGQAEEDASEEMGASWSREAEREGDARPPWRRKVARGDLEIRARRIGGNAPMGGQGEREIGASEKGAGGDMAGADRGAGISAAGTSESEAGGNRGIRAAEKGARRRSLLAADPGVGATERGTREHEDDSGRPTSRLARPSFPPALEALLEGLEDADAFELDERFRRALSLEQRLEARIGPFLALAWRRPVHRALSYATRDAYVRERLGMDPTRARALVRLERTAAESEAFARGYRTGALSWVKASVLAPLVSADPLGWFVSHWVTWAGRVTVRRLREDVEEALTLSETDPEAFGQSGGLPVEARGDREIGATEKGAPHETCWARFIGPADVVQLFRAVLCTVRRRMEKDTGRLPTEGEALGAMLDHVFSSWGELDEKVAARYKIYSRDGWRCAVPGCTSMQNLHDHHIRFRSAKGSDALENRITLCAFHHLRGVHAGLLRCVGRAPDRLRWEMGIRPGVTPRLVYRSGDLRVPAMAP